MKHFSIKFGSGHYEVEMWLEYECVMITAEHAVTKEKYQANFLACAWRRYIQGQNLQMNNREFYHLVKVALQQTDPQVTYLTQEIPLSLTILYEQRFGQAVIQHRFPIDFTKVEQSDAQRMSRMMLTLDEKISSLSPILELTSQLHTVTERLQTIETLNQEPFLDVLESSDMRVRMEALEAQNQALFTRVVALETQNQALQGRMDSSLTSLLYLCRRTDALEAADKPK